MFLALHGAGLIIVSLIAFILILGLIISLHELGHLLLAKRSGILCYEYSLGMGPVIYKRMIGETRFCIRAIPIGGFVSMAGTMTFDDDIKKEESVGVKLDDEGKVKTVVLDPEVEADIRGKIKDLDLIGADSKEKFIIFEETEDYYLVADNAEYLFEKGQTIPIPPYDRTFDSKGKMPRFLTMVAGPVMNFILAIVIYFIVSFSYGVVNNSSNKIGSLTDNLAAKECGIKKGDRITAVYLEGEKIEVTSWSSMSKTLNKNYDIYNTTLKLEVSGNDYTLEAVTILNSIGISNYDVDYENVALSEIPGVSGVNGLRLGSHFSGWKNDIETDDYITKIKINDDVYDVNTGLDVVLNENTYHLTGWGLLSYLMDTKVGKGEPTIYLEYYHLNDNNTKNDTSDDYYQLVTIEDGIKNKDKYKPYTDEVLKSQGIKKIEHYVGFGATTKTSIKCIPQAFEMFMSDFTMIFRTLKVLLFPSDVRQVSVNNLSGFVGIFGMVKSYVNSGIIPLLAFAAMLSVNIGVVNLLPIPALDGGRILFVIIEAITKKKVPKKVENIINLVFMGLLFLLIIFVTYNDILRMF